MAITDFQLSAKTKRPTCCNFCCCGNKFGRIERSKYCKVHHGINRIKRSRRYVKHVERQLIQQEIREQILEAIEYREIEFLDNIKRIDEEFNRIVELKAYQEFQDDLEYRMMQEKYPYFDMDMD
jgi:hypothetical protein